VLQAAADAGVFSIGVDSNQNHLHPGSVLTSMMKRVDNAVYDVFVEATEGSFEPGIQVLDLANDGVGYAVDDNNSALITEDMKAAVSEARAGIIDGSISVHDYISDDNCPIE